MANGNEQFTEIHRKNMEAAMRLAQLAVDNSQRIMALQAELAKALFDESVANAKALSGASGPDEAVSLRTRYARETTRKMIDAAQKIAEIGNETRSEFSHLLTEQLASGGQEMADAFQSFLKVLPGQSPNVMDVVQQAMNTANTAFEQISKASAAAFSAVQGASARDKK